MEGEQKRVFLVLADDEIDSWNPTAKGNLFYKVFVSSAGNVDFRKDDETKEKSICFDSKKYVDSCFRMPNGGRSPYHSPEKGKNKGECL